MSRSRNYDNRGTVSFLDESPITLIQKINEKHPAENHFGPDILRFPKWYDTLKSD